jgi:hypothetical protein
MDASLSAHALRVLHNLRRLVVSWLVPCGCVLGHADMWIMVQSVRRPDLRRRGTSPQGRPSSLPRPDRMNEALDVRSGHGSKVARIEGTAIDVRHQYKF